MYQVPKPPVIQGSLNNVKSYLAITCLEEQSILQRLNQGRKDCLAWNEGDSVILITQEVTDTHFKLLRLWEGLWWTDFSISPVS